MKAKLEYLPGEVFMVTSYEKGDEPEGAVDVPPALLNQWQKAELAAQYAVYDILKHLRETGQEPPSRPS